MLANQSFDAPLSVKIAARADPARKVAGPLMPPKNPGDIINGHVIISYIVFD